MAHFIIVNKKTGQQRMAPGSEIAGVAGNERVGAQVVDGPERWPRVDLAEDEVLINADESIWDSEAGVVKPLFTPVDQQVRELSVQVTERLLGLEVDFANLFARIAELERKFEESRWSWEVGEPTNKPPEGPPIDNTGDRDGKPPIEWEIEHGQSDKEEVPPRASAAAAPEQRKKEVSGK